MINLISPIKNLHIETDFPELNLYCNKTSPKFLNKEIVDNYGLVFYDSLHNYAIFKLEFDSLNEDITSFNTKFNHSNYMNFYFPLWLIKDSCIYSYQSYIYFEGTNKFFIDTSNVFLSRADGTYVTETFCNEDIYKVLKNRDKIAKLLSKEKVKPEIISQLNNNSFSTNTIDYFKTSKFFRCIFFIKKARTTIDVIEKISYYIICLESLYASNGNNSDLKYKLSYKIPHFLAENEDSKQKYHFIIKEGYDIRSSFLHGATSKKFRSINLQQLSVDLDFIIRETLNKILNDDLIEEMFLNSELLEDYFHSRLLQ